MEKSGLVQKTPPRRWPFGTLLNTQGSFTQPRILGAMGEKGAQKEGNPTLLGAIENFSP